MAYRGPHIAVGLRRAGPRTEAFKPFRHIVVVESPSKAQAVTRSLNGFVRLLAKAATGQLEPEPGQRRNPLVEDWARSLEILAANEQAEDIDIVQQILEMPQRYAIIATRGHFRSLFPHTPSREPAPDELPPWQLPDFRRGWSDDDVDAYRRAYREFITRYPATNGSDPAEPETNPARYLGVDVTQGFQPIWMTTNPSVHRTLLEHVAMLAQQSFPGEDRRDGPLGTVYIATDPDREGELIGWHVRRLLEQWADETGNELAFRRLRYQAMTFSDLARALLDLDENLAPASSYRMAPELVVAASMREVLDRLIGYPLSRALQAANLSPANPETGRARSLSAGRVQIAALDLLMQDEERALQQLPQPLAKVSVQTVVPSHGRLSRDRITFNAASTRPLVASRDGGDTLRIVGATLEQKTYRPQPWLSLADLQQTAWWRHHINASAALEAAQELFQRGFTTYPRSDMRSVSAAGRRELEEMATLAGLPLAGQNRGYSSKGRAQEAHEAIRPKLPDGTPPQFDRPDEANRDHPAWLMVAYLRRTDKAVIDFADWASKGPWANTAGLDRRALQVYDVIFRRSLAPLLPDASTEVRILTATHPAIADAEGELQLIATSETWVEPGFHTIWPPRNVPHSDASAHQGSPIVLPDLRAGDTVDIHDVDVQLEVVPVKRPDVQGLVRKLDEAGIGRPSSTAKLLEKLERRGYVRRRGGMSRFGALITSMLRETAGEAVDVETTAHLEQAIDDLIAIGPDSDTLRFEAHKLLDSFYTQRLPTALEQLRTIASGFADRMPSAWADPHALGQPVRDMEGLEPERDDVLAKHLSREPAWHPLGSAWLTAGPDWLVAVWRQDGAVEIRLWYFYATPAGEQMTGLLGAQAGSGRNELRDRLEGLTAIVTGLNKVGEARGGLDFIDAWTATFLLDAAQKDILDWNTTFPTLRRCDAPECAAAWRELLHPGPANAD